MTEQQGVATPYTEQDLRAEAARYLGDDWDSLGIITALAEREPWASLPQEQFNEAFDKILDLVTGASDLSRWAVDMGTEGLMADRRFVDIGSAGRIGVRVHFAFHPDMPEAMRASVVDAVRQDTASLNEDGIQAS